MNKNNNNIHDQKHLTLTDRTYIEQELSIGSSFKSIATTLHKDPTTISKEVRKHAKIIRGRGASSFCDKCKHFRTCTIRGGDSFAKDCKRSSYCTKVCKRCLREKPPLTCSIYVPFKCKQPTKPPYVCNACEEEKLCPLNHFFYQASTAQRQYERTLVKSREGYITILTSESSKPETLIYPAVFGIKSANYLALRKQRILSRFTETNELLLISNVF